MSNREELLREYYVIQERIAEFDQHQNGIKAWATTAIAALIGIAYSEYGDVILLLIAAFAALVFWYIDAQWKSFQIIAIRHGRNLEKIFSSDGPYPDGPTIGAHYDASFKLLPKIGRFLYSFTQTNVWLPHLPLGVIALSLYYNKMGWKFPFVEYAIGWM